MHSTIMIIHIYGQKKLCLQNNTKKIVRSSVNLNRYYMLRISLREKGYKIILE